MRRLGPGPLLALAALLAACAPASAPRPALAGVPGPSEIPGWTPPTAEPRPFTAADYAARRAELADTMEEGVFVAFGGIASSHGPFPFLQDRNFQYLTGIVEPDAGLIIVKRAGRIDERLFVQPRDPARELWEGSRLGLEAAEQRSGIRAEPSDSFLPALERLIRREGVLYLIDPPMYDLTGDEVLSRQEQLLEPMLRRSPDTRIRSIAQPLNLLRASKSELELDMIRRAAAISGLAHREAMRSLHPGMNEFEIQAMMEFVFRRHGADGPAYASIVGSGPNSTILHYSINDRFMHEGEVLLLDLGASYRGYAADITRTLPVGGRFTPEQRALYEIVLAALKATEEAVEVDASWDDLNRIANRILEEGLTDLGLIDAPGATYACPSPHTRNRCPQLRLYYMHGLGHGLGLDVHDPEISYFESFQPGSAFTLEPGLYVRASVLDEIPDLGENHELRARLLPAVERFRDIGIRIEDDYILHAEGVERISAGVPREIEEIEAMMNASGLGASGRDPAILEWFRATREAGQ